MIHSLDVTMGGAGTPDAGARAAILDAFIDLIARPGGAGARAAGDPAEDGVETAGDAIVAKVNCRIEADRRKRKRAAQALGNGCRTTISCQSHCRDCRAELKRSKSDTKIF
jgi:hypothetical protein